MPDTFYTATTLMVFCPITVLTPEEELQKARLKQAVSKASECKSLNLDIISKASKMKKKYLRKKT